jgi:hypothetical protein
MVDLGVTIDFERYFVSGLVVEARDDLGKRAFAEDFENLESVKDVVIDYQLVVPLLIIELPHR